MRSKSYSLEEDEYIAKWYGKIRVPSIARYLDRTPRSIDARILRQGIKRNAPTGNFLITHCRTKIKNLISRGNAAWQIVEKLGIKDSYLRKIVKEELPEKYKDKLAANGIANRKNKINRSN